MDAEVVPVLYIEDASRAISWYERLGFPEHEGDARPNTLIHLHVDDVGAISKEFDVPIDEDGLAGCECDFDPDGNRLRAATRRS